jgi:predicted PurR-regulated permease PerM
MQPRFLKLLKSRRAVSAVISNMILVAAVIAVGFAMLGWAQSQSSNYTNQYGRAISSDINQLQERIVFEYIRYDNAKNNLTVYLMNSGTIGNVIIATVYVNNTPNSTIVLRLLSSGASISSLNATQEGYFSIIPYPSLASGANYSIKIITGRGSSFVGTFST